MFRKAILNNYGTYETFIGSKTKGHIYSPDGLHRIKKTGQMQDTGRRKIGWMIEAIKKGWVK